MCLMAEPVIQETRSEDVCFCTVDHTQSYEGHIFPQWLLQVVMTGDRTGYPKMREQALSLGVLSLKTKNFEQCSRPLIEKWIQVNVSPGICRYIVID